MSEAATAKFSCPSCGRQFSWKAELAGRSAKCKCGATIKVPAAPSVSPAAPARPARAAAASAPAADDGNPLDSFDFSHAEPAPTAARGGGRAAASAPAADAALRCPSCSGAMLAGAVICVNCGFNLKTGKRMSTLMGGPEADAPPAPAVPGVPGYAGPPGLRPPRAQPESKTDVAGMVKMILVPVLLIGVVGGAVFGYKKLAGEKDTGPSLGEDKEVRAMIRDDGKTELKKWLAEKQERLVTGMTREQADGMADRLYKMGAVEVFAFGGVMTASIGVELPQDKAKRREIFEWYWRRYEEEVSAAERTRDVGQKYMLVRTGL